MCFFTNLCEPNIRHFGDFLRSTRFLNHILIQKGYNCAFMLNSRRVWLVTGYGLALLFGPIRSSLAADRQFLQGHVPPAVARLQPLGHLPGTNCLNLAIGLPLRNQAELDELLRQLYDPASTNFHRFLTSAESAARFGPTEEDYQAVEDFVRGNGLVVAGTYSNHVVLDIQGRVADVERAFGVTLRTYRHPTEARDFLRRTPSRRCRQICG